MLLPILLHALVESSALFGGEGLGQFGAVLLYDLAELAAGAGLVGDELGASNGGAEALESSNSAVRPSQLMSSVCLRLR